MQNEKYISDIKELAYIVRSVFESGRDSANSMASKRLLNLTIDQNIREEIRDLAEAIALLLVQKEGVDFNLEYTRENLQKELHLARHDVLTGLPNRELFYERLGEHVQYFDAATDKMALMLLDLDMFKAVNDTYGHQAGDRLLQLAAARIKDVVDVADFVARLGGDEFTILNTKVKHEETVVLCAERILKVLKKPFELEEATVRIDASIGIAFMDDSVKQGSELLKNADKAMYAAKQAGKGRFELYGQHV